MNILFRLNIFIAVFSMAAGLSAMEESQSPTAGRENRSKSQAEGLHLGLPEFLLSEREFAESGKRLFELAEPAAPWIQASDSYRHLKAKVLEARNIEKRCAGELEIGLHPIDFSEFWNEETTLARRAHLISQLKHKGGILKRHLEQLHSVLREVIVADSRYMNAMSSSYALSVKKLIDSLQFELTEFERYIRFEESEQARKTKQIDADVCTQNPFLWVVESQTSTRPSFVFGTLHLSDPKVLALSEVTREALRVSDAIYTEISMGLLTSMSMGFLTAWHVLARLEEAETPSWPGTLALQTCVEFVLPKLATKYRSIVPSLLDAEIEAVVTQTLQLMNARELIRFIEATASDLVNVEKVEHASGQVQLQLRMPEPKLDSVGINFLDRSLADYAWKHKKQTGALETVNEHAAAFVDIANMLASDEAVFEVLNLLKDWEKAHPGEPFRDLRIQEMIQAYLKGNPKELEELMPLNSKNAEVLLKGRDEVMAQRIVEKMTGKPGKSYFFAVGVKHLLTEDTGVIARLAKEGFKVRRLTCGDAAELARVSSGAARSTFENLAEYFR